MKWFPYNHPIKDSCTPSTRAAGQMPPGPGSSLPLSGHSPKTTLGVLPNICWDRPPHLGSQRQQPQKGVSVRLPRSPALRGWLGGVPVSAPRTPTPGPGGSGWCCTTLGRSQKHCWYHTPAHRSADGRTQALSTAATCPCVAQVTWHSEPHSELQAPFPLHDSNGHQDKSTHRSD